MGVTGFDVDQLDALQSIADNTKMIAEQLCILNSLVNQLNGMLELLYKNGLPIK